MMASSTANTETNYEVPGTSPRELLQEAGDEVDGNEDAFKLGLFGVLYTVSKEKEEPSLWYVAFWLVLEFLQMFLLTVSPAYGWQFDGGSKGWKVASFIQLNDFLSGRGYNFFLAFMYLMSGLLVLNVCFCVWVAQSFQANRFDQVWPIVFLRWFGSIFFSLLDIASMNLFLTALDCSYFDRPEDVIGYNQEFPDTYCWSMPHAVHATVAALSLMVFVALALMFQMADMELNPVTRNKLAIAHTRTEVINFVLRLIMTCATTFVNGVKWLAVILCLCTLCIVYMYIRWQPHVYPWVNHVRCGTYAAVAYSALLLAALTYGEQDHRFAVTTAMWAGLAPAAVVGAVASFFRHRYLTKTVADRLLDADPGTKSKYIYEFKDAREVEITARVCRVWINSDTLDKEAMQDAETILKAGMQQLPNSAYMIIVYASFLIDVQGSYATGYSQLQAAKKRELSFLESFAVFSREQLHTQKASAMDAGEDQATSLVSYVELMRAKRQVLRLHTEALLALRSFWEACLQPHPSFNALARCVQRIEGTVRAAERVYKQVLLRHNTNTQLLRLYAKFLEDIKQDPWGSSKWMAEAERLQKQEEEQKDRNAWGGKKLAEAALDMPEDTKQALVVVNASCIVQVANEAVKNLVGWSKAELKGRNISALIPTPYGEEHGRWVKQYIDGDREGVVLNKVNEFMVVHKDRYVVPVRLQVTALGGVQDDTMFCGIIKAVPVEEGAAQLWLRPDSGNVIASNLAFLDVFGFKSDELLGRPLGELLCSGLDPLLELLQEVRSSYAKPRHVTRISIERYFPQGPQSLHNSVQMAQGVRMPMQSTSGGRNSTQTPWLPSGPNAGRTSAAGSNERWQLDQTIRVCHKYLNSAVEVSVSLHVAGMGKNLLHVLTLKRAPTPPNTVRGRHLLLAVDRKGHISYISNELAQQLGMEPSAVQGSGGATLEQIMPQPFAQLHMKYAAEGMRHDHHNNQGSEMPLHSCCTGLSVCLLPKAHRSQAGAAAGQQPQPYRISVNKREPTPGEVYHVMQLERSTMEQALDERRLRLTLSCTGTVVSVDSASPASLFGFDPKLLVGRSVATFIDALRPVPQQAAEGEVEGEDDEPSAVRAFGLNTRLDSIDEMDENVAEPEAALPKIMLELATRAAQYPGMSYRVGVSQPMEQEELMQFGPMADAVLAQRTRPAVMKVSVRLPDALGGASSEPAQKRQQGFDSLHSAVSEAATPVKAPAEDSDSEARALQQQQQQQQAALIRLMNPAPHAAVAADPPRMPSAGTHGLLAARVTGAHNSQMQSRLDSANGVAGRKGIASLASRAHAVGSAAVRTNGVAQAQDGSDSILRLSRTVTAHVRDSLDIGLLQGDPLAGPAARSGASFTQDHRSTIAAGPVAEGTTSDGASGHNGGAWDTPLEPRALSSPFAAAGSSFVAPSPGGPLASASTQAFRRLPGRFASVGQGGKWSTVGPSSNLLERASSLMGQQATARLLRKSSTLGYSLAAQKPHKRDLRYEAVNLPKNVLIEVELWRSDLLVGVLEVDGNTGFVVPSGPSDHPLNPAGLLLGVPTPYMYKQPVASFLPPTEGHPVSDLFEHGLGIKPGQPAKRGLLKPGSSLHKRKVLGAVNTMAVPHLGDEAPVEISVQAVRKLGRSDDMFLVMRFANPTCAREDFAEWVLTPPPEPQEGPAITSQGGQGLVHAHSGGAPAANPAPAHSHNRQLDEASVGNANTPAGFSSSEEGNAVVSGTNTVSGANAVSGAPSVVSGANTVSGYVQASSQDMDPTGIGGLDSHPLLLRRGISADNPGSCGSGSGALAMRRALSSTGPAVLQLQPRPPSLTAHLPRASFTQGSFAPRRYNSSQLINATAGPTVAPGNVDLIRTLTPLEIEIQASYNVQPWSAGPEAGVPGKTAEVHAGVLGTGSAQAAGTREIDEDSDATTVRGARAGASHDGGAEPTSDADVAGGSFRADYNRGKRFRRLVALMSDVQAQALIKRFRSHIWLCLLLLAMVDLVAFVVMTLKTNSQQCHINDLESAATAASKVWEASISTRKLGLLLNNRTVSTLPDLNNPAEDVPRLLAELSAAAEELTYLHHGVYLGFPHSDEPLSYKYGLRELWEKPSINVTAFYDTVDGLQSEGERMGAWYLGNTFLTSITNIVKTVPRDYNDSTAGQRFMNWSAPNFILANGPTGLFGAYSTTLDGLVQLAIDNNSHVNTIQLIILSAEGVFMCFAVMCYMWMLSRKLARHRHNVYTVFMHVPQATIRALVLRRIALDEEGEGEEDYGEGDVEDPRAPASAHGFKDPGSPGKEVLFARQSIDHGNHHHHHHHHQHSPAGASFSRDMSLMLGVGRNGQPAHTDAPSGVKGSPVHHVDVSATAVTGGHHGVDHGGGGGGSLQFKRASTGLEDLGYGNRARSLWRIASMIPQTISRMGGGHPAWTLEATEPPVHGPAAADSSHMRLSGKYTSNGGGRLLRQASFASSAKRRLRKSLKDTIYVTVPLCLWCAFIIGINCGGYSLMAGMDNPIATLNTANFVLLRTQTVIFYAQELVTASNVTAKAALRGGLASEVDKLQEEYNIMLYGAMAEMDTSDHSTFAERGMLADSGDGAVLLYDYTGCLALDPRDCMTEDRPYYESAHHGLHSLLQAYVQAMRTLLREPAAATNMSAWEYAFQVEAAEADLKGGLERLSSVYTDHVNGIYSRVKLLHALALSMALVLVLGYLLLIMRPLGRQIQYETKRIAELLSQLPPEVDTLSLLQRALAAGNGRKGHTPRTLSLSGSLKGGQEWGLARARSGRDALGDLPLQPSRRRPSALDPSA